MGIVKKTEAQPLIDALLREFNGHITTENMEPGALDAAKVLRADSVAALPVAPLDGEVTYYQGGALATAGELWAFKYRAGSGSTYKWEFAGGSPLVSRVQTSETTTSTTYVALATPGPSIVLPLAGEYEIRLGARIANNSGVGNASVMSFDVGATAAVDADGAVGTTTGAISVVSHVRKVVDPAVTLTAKYRVSGGAETGTFIERWMEAIPIRVT